MTLAVLLTSPLYPSVLATSRVTVPTLPGAMTLSYLLVVQPQEVLTLLISKSTFPSFLISKAWSRGVPAFTEPKECSRDGMDSLGFPLSWAETENANISRDATATKAVLDLMKLTSVGCENRSTGWYSRQHPG